MKIRHIALGIVLSMCAATNSMAITTSTNSNTNIDSQNFRSSPFVMQTNNMRISQSFNDDGEMCQYFTMQNENMFIRQLVVGFNFFQQSFGFGSPPSPAPDDPCI